MKREKRSWEMQAWSLCPSPSPRDNIGRGRGPGGEGRGVGDTVFFFLGWKRRGGEGR
jgi:hypothetical protein